MSYLDYDREREAIAAAVAPFNAELVELIKTIPGRRYDATTRRWLIPSERAGQAAATLVPFGFKPTDAFKERFPASSKAEKTEETEKIEKVEEAPGLRVGELLERIHGLLRRGFPQPVWVIGTLMGYERAKGRHHLSFQLADLDENNLPTSSVPLRIFHDEHERIKRRFEKSGIELRDGLKVLFQVRVDLWIDRGELQLVAIDADPAFTAADLGRVLEVHYEKLKAEGIASKNLSIPLPLIPLRIGLVAAAESEGYNDFVHELERSGLPFEVSWINCRMQGPETAPSVIRALKRFAKEEIDLVAIARGGGANADLSWFNDLSLGRAVCLAPFPVLVGIGHHRDRTLLDWVARSEKTPTAVAGFLVRTVADAVGELNNRALRVLSETAKKLEMARLRLKNQGLVLESLVLKNVHAHSRMLEERRSRLRFVPAILGAQTLSLRARASSLLGAGVRMQLKGEERFLKEQRERFRTSALRALERNGHILSLQKTQLAAFDPLQQMKHGFTLVSDGDGTWLKSLSQIRVGGEVRLRFPDGAAAATVQRILERREGSIDGSTGKL